MPAPPALERRCAVCLFLAFKQPSPAAFLFFRAGITSEEMKRKLFCPFTPIDLRVFVWRKNNIFKERKMKKFYIVLGLVLVAALVVSCAPAAESAPVAEAVEVAADSALKMSGLVEKGWSLDDLNALPVTEAEYTNKDGETKTYSGVSFSDILKAAAVENYAAVTLIAADDYSAEVDQKTLDACTTCIIAIEDDGGLRSVMPGMQSALQVKDLVALEVK
jgi:hypothetical protein